MAKRNPTKEESEHMGRVANLGCIACHNNGIETCDVEIHHINSGAMGKRSSNFEVIGLCHAHHRTGGYGVAVHAGKREWEKKNGKEVDLLNQVREALGEA